MIISIDEEKLFDKFFCNKNNQKLDLKGNFQILRKKDYIEGGTDRNPS